MKDSNMDQGTTGGTNQQNGEGVDIEALKADRDAIIAERDTLKTQLRDLKNASANVSKLQEERDALLTKTTQLTEEFNAYKGQIREERVNTHIQTALEASGAHNPARVKQMLDMSKVQIADDGTIQQESLVKVINELKQTDGYLFKTTKTVGNEQTQNSGNTTSSSHPGVKNAADNTGDAFKIALENARKDRKDPFGAIQKVLDSYSRV
jgi:septal ring factor EnvC (AmiA/AmiB activator)